jgi:hypothetical protein
MAAKKPYTDDYVNGYRAGYCTGYDQGISDGQGQGYRDAKYRAFRAVEAALPDGQGARQAVKALRAGLGDES